MKLLVLVMLMSVAFGADTKTSTVIEGGTISINCGKEAITIVSGKYICNNDNRASDKTAILGGRCNGKTTCSVGANNGVFSDPFPGCPKKFTSVWRCNKEVEVDEGGTVNLNCGTGKINVLSAHYICKSDNRESDKTSYVSSACNDRSACSYGANNGNMGDPFPGCGKKLRVIYDCKVDPCANKNCDDGKYCNGEEYCDNGQCKPSANGNITCPNFFVCSNLHKKCVRDCGRFAIDGYLRECSAEFETSQNAINGLGNDIQSANVRIDGEAAKITANQGEINKNTGNISSNADAIDANKQAIDSLRADLKKAQQDIAECKRELDGFGPLPNANPPEAKENQSTFPVFNVYLLMVGLIIANMILMAIMFYRCIYKRIPKKHGYKRVVTYPSSDEQESKD